MTFENNCDWTKEPFATDCCDVIKPIEKHRMICKYCLKELIIGNTLWNFHMNKTKNIYIGTEELNAIEERFAYYGLSWNNTEEYLVNELGLEINKFEESSAKHKND